jgi:hypothetical protein
MTSRRRLEVNKRWDITIGLAATAIAMVGLASSIATSNRGYLFGSVALVAVACIFGVLTGIKWWRGQSRSAPMSGSPKPMNERN